jgi:hypothetical protein
LADSDTISILAPRMLAEQLYSVLRANVEFQH